MPLKSTVKTTAWDAADYLQTTDDVAAYLAAAFEAGDAAGINVAIGTVARSKGMSLVSEQSGVTRESLYKSLSKTGNPEFATIVKVLKTFGLRLTPTRMRATSTQAKKTRPPKAPKQPETSDKQTAVVARRGASRTPAAKAAKKVAA